jgi:ABC-2 type transporter
MCSTGLTKRHHSGDTSVHGLRVKTNAYEDDKARHHSVIIINCVAASQPGCFAVLCEFCLRTLLFNQCMFCSLSRNGRTIIFSIHQPRYSIFKLFDRLTLLAAGRTVYHGPASEALSFFKSLGNIYLLKFRFVVLLNSMRALVIKSDFIEYWFDCW